MWHLSKISYDEVTIDILSNRDSEFGFMSGKCYVFKDFFDSYGISFLIWYLYTYESKTRDWCLDTDGLCLESECEIFFESFDLRETYSFAGTQTILYDSRSDTLIFHIDIDSKLEKCFFYEE